MDKEYIGRRLRREDLEKINLSNDLGKLFKWAYKEQGLMVCLRQNQIIIYEKGGKVLSIFFDGNAKNSRWEIKNIDSAYFNVVRKEIEHHKIGWFDENNNCKDCNLEDLKETVKIVKKAVGDYQEKKAKEKVIQSELMQKMNKESDKFYVVDLEYNIETLSDYVYDTKGKKVPGEKREHKTVTPGRTDLLAISKTRNGKYDLYFIEVKNGTGAMGGASKKDKKYGSGVVGHIYKYMTIINNIKKKTPYKSSYMADMKTTMINIHDAVFDDIKNIMNFYKKIGLISDNKFKHFNIEKATIKDVELLFYLGGENPINSFKNHLGIGKKSAKLNVRDLLNDSSKLGLKYIKLEEMNDFYYRNSEKVTEACLDLINYDRIEKNRFEK